MTHVHSTSPMTGTTRTLRAATFAGVLALTFALTGCLSDAPSPATTPASETSSAETTPTAEPVDPLTTVTALVARPDGLELHAHGGGVVATLDYLASPADTVAALTTVFGTPPVDEEYDGSSHYPPSTAHRWDAFELWEQRYVDRWEGVVVDVSLAHPSFMVLFTGSDVHGIDLTTSEGWQVGDDWSGLLDADGIMTNPSGCSGPYLEFVELHRENPDGAPTVLKISVDFRASGDDASIAGIAAPIPVFEDGCA